jgi:Fe-S oxidoreductase
MSAPDESDRHFGAAALEHFSWKDVLDLYSCTECGRCQSHCPAYLTGKVLSPKTLITDLRDAAYEQLKGGYDASRHAAHPEPGTGSAEGQRAGEPVMWVTGGGPGSVRDIPGSFQPSWLSPDRVGTAVAGNGGERPLIGGVIGEETLWACTMCGACMDQCPVFIEHGVPPDPGLTRDSPLP